MNKKTTFHTSLSAAVLIALSACGGGGSGGNSDDDNSENTAPTVSAGSNQSVTEGVTVQLAGSGADSEGGVQFSWRQSGAPSVSLSDSSSATPTFTAPLVDADTLLRFTLTVTDEDGVTAQDSVEITVSDSNNNAITAPLHFYTPNNIVVDTASNRALVSDLRLNKIFAVDLTTGTLSLFSDLQEDSVADPLTAVTSMILDSANDRLLAAATILDKGRGIVAIDLNTAERTIIVDASSSAELSGFATHDIALDSVANRLFIGDGDDAVLELNLGNLAISVLSNDDTPNSTNRFVDIDSMVIDPNNNRLLAGANGAFSQVLAVDLDSGERSRFSDGGVPDGNTNFNASSLLLDQANDRLLMGGGQNGKGDIVAADLTTGARTVFSDDDTPSTNLRFNGADAMAMDSNNNRLLLVDEDLNAVIAVNISNGERSLLQQSTVPAIDHAFTPSNAGNTEVDTTNNRLLVADNDRLITVDLSNGERALFATADFSNFKIDHAAQRIIAVDATGVLAYDMGSGSTTTLSLHPDDFDTKFLNLFTLDTTNNRLYGLGGPAFTSIIEVDLSTGQRTVLSDATTPNSDLPFTQIADVIADTSNNRLLVVDKSEALIAVDLSNGERSQFADIGSALIDPQRIALDDTNNRVLITDAAGEIAAVDLDSGDVSEFSSEEDHSGHIIFDALNQIAVDDANNQALVFEQHWGGIISIDLTTGKRTLLSTGMSR